MVGQYGLALKGLRGSFGALRSILSAAGIMGGLTGVFTVMRNSIGIVKDYEKSNAILAGVLNKTVEEITELTDDSKRLGAITAKTAQEVNDLQIAYARL